MKTKREYCEGMEGGSKTLVFYYSYGMGGWGDLLKGLHTCWCWAKATGRALRIDFRKHVFGDVFPQYGKELMLRLEGAQVLNLIDKVGGLGVEEIAKVEADVIVVACNWFHPNSVKGVEREVVLAYYDALYRDLFSVSMEGVGVEEGTYRVFHCRMGDKYLSEAYACKGDNRIGSMAVLAEQIRAFGGVGDANGGEGNKTMVCSDHASVIRSLLTQIPNSFCMCTEPYHIAYYRDDLVERLGPIRAMIYEHFVMSRSTGIWMAAYSGFPITAAMVGGVPLVLKGETYRDDYVDFVRGLRA
jgi:hypothetical protein